MDKTSLGFQKPKEEEYYDINIFNQNAQLANDLIEKNSSAIGQKLDKNSSFYADLEAYYGNTKLIDDFQLLTGWSVGTVDVTNIKIGNQSIKLVETDNIESGIETIKNNISLNLEKINNDEESTDSDYISIVCYISDITKVSNLSIVFDQASSFTGVDIKIKDFTILDLVTGWNFLKIKKSDFVTAGTGSWNNIQSIRLRWDSTANAQNAYVSFQLIQLVKADPDTLLNIPNPFQKFGNREFEIINGEWFVGKEFDRLVIKNIGLGGEFNKNALISQKLFSDFIMTVSRNTVNVGVDAYTCWYVDNNNFVEFFISGVTSNATIRKTVNGVTTVEAEATPPIKNNETDVIVWKITKKGDEINVELKVQGQQEKVHLNAKNIGINNQGVMSLGNSGTEKGDYYLSASITEISHAHHSDTSELAKSLEYRELKIPSLIMDRYKIKTFSEITPADTTQKEIEIDLGSKYFSGSLEVTLSSGYNIGNAMGSIRKIIDFIGITSVIRQESRYVHISDYTKDFFSISDIYVRDGRKYIKIIQNSGSKNFLGVTIEAFGEFQDFEKATIGEYKPNSDTFVEPSMTPKETVITSGFATGWSGQLKYGITQEGELYINHTGLSKTSDILHFEVLYQFPSSLLRYIGSSSNIGVASTGSVVNNSSVTLYLESSGRLIATNHGSVTIGVRKIIDGTIVASKY